MVFAQAMFDVDTTGVEPMFTVLEDHAVDLREDVADESCLGIALNNATKVAEEYIVAPPGNIELKRDDSLSH